MSLRLGMQTALWPTERAVLSAQAYMALAARLRPFFLARMKDLQLDAALAESLMRVYLPLAAWVVQQKPEDRTLVLGVNGAQGSGKSTLCEFLQLILHHGYALRVAGLSIDDIYLTRAERERLGHEVHPLLVTRGVPGTHDVDLGLETLLRLTDPAGGRVALPRFDKSQDERCPVDTWPVVQAPVDIVIFEGWCVGARPQDAAELAIPLNELEMREDADGSWRRYVNEQLKGPYARLFARLDRLIMLKVPNLESVYEWRSLQEEKLAAQLASGGQHRLMDSSGLKRFIMHYERLTRHMLEEMPQRADLTLFLDEQHCFTAIHVNA